MLVRDLGLDSVPPASTVEAPATAHSGVMGTRVGQNDVGLCGAAMWTDHLKCL